MDINAAAPVVTRDEIFIHAPIETVWDIQTDVASWPSWRPDVDGARADGPLTVRSVFRWQTAGLDITSTVEEVDAPRRIVWGGPAQGSAATARAGPVHTAPAKSLRTCVKIPTRAA